MDVAPEPVAKELRMPDTPVDRPDPAPYDPRHEARISRLEDEMSEVKSTLGQMLPVLVRIDSMLSATLPHLATKAELADLRSDVQSKISDLRTEEQSDFASVKSQLAAISAGMAHLATKAELAEKPSKAYLWGVLAALIATYATGLAGLAVLLH
jgi:hypothetical protein